MRHLDLFTGIGGFAYAAQTVWGDDYELVATCEIDSYCQRVIQKHWPGTPNHNDITKMDGTQYAGTIDLVSGGFPCQPYSLAGKQKGAEDDRALWPQMLRVISEVRPNWVLAENVAGIIHMELDKVLSDLGGAGYQTEVFNIPAAGVDAKHRRERIWIIAHSGSERCDNRNVADTQDFSEWPGLCENKSPAIRRTRFSNSSRLVPDTITERPQRQRKTGTAAQTIDRSGNGRDYFQWAIEPAVGRVAHGIPSRVDRLRGLGNAIVPQVAMAIFQAIKESETI